jgi:GT2 family glycosyltransferase
MDERICPATVVIPTIGRLPLLRRAVESVLACRPGAAEVVVVDQSHGDEVARLVEVLAHPQLRRVEDAGRGIGRALNIGLRSARQPIVLVTHDDCRVREDWVLIATHLLAERPSLLVTGRVEPGASSTHVPSCKTDLTAEEHQGSFRYDLLYCNNWAATKGEIAQLGGFDERAGLRLAAEDCDLCFRWTVLGRPVRYEPEMVVWHQDWRSEAHLRRTYRTYGRGLGVFYAKHLLAGHRQLLRYLRLDLTRGLAHSWRGRLRGEPAGLDADRGLLLGVPVGLVTGCVEELRLRRAARRAARAGDRDRSNAPA